MEDAEVTPEQVDAVHYHGTATQMNDALETLAVKRVFGEHATSGRLAGHSVKGMIGHPQGASGLAAMVATLAGLTAGDPFLFPTINLQTPDPACNLNYTPNRSRATDARTVLVNCLAFGAKNSALVVRVR